MRADSASDVVNEIKDNGGQAIAHSCDVADHNQIKGLVASIGKNDPINIFINNAGIAHIGDVEHTTEADFDKIYNVNVKGGL